ncbi:MAG: hypothetical protein ACUVTG_10525, partial [Candidatus Oleimicrobiaceae bacterium]
SGAHMTLFPAVLELLRKEGAEHILLFGGGIIPEKDIAVLQEMGVGRLFTPGTSLEEIIEYVREAVPATRGSASGSPASGPL